MAAEAQQRRKSRIQNVFIRPDDEVGAMSWNQRLKKRVKHAFALDNENEDAEEEDASGSGRGHKTQYRLEATRRAMQQKSLLRKILTCSFLCASRQSHAGLGVGKNPNQSLAYYLHWMFRVNFIFLFVVMCVAFFALVILFAGFITIAGNMDAECVRIGGEEFGSAGAAFADAFSLSWTTFSTVGYGSTYTALGYENDSPTNCFFINFICSLEALLGVLYSGFCGAILFGKVLRIQSHAQVIFSDPLVIRYGNGVMIPGSEDQNPGTDSSDEESAKLPCPVVEFRIVNRLFSEPGGEIMDASLNVVANIDADDADPTLREALEINSSKPNSMGVNGTSVDSASVDDDASSSPSMDDSVSTGRNLPTIFGPGSLLYRKNNQALDEGQQVSKMIFSKMMIEAAEHPFFKRVWLARHVLDEYSPILKPKVRKLLRKNGGSWPEKLNCYNGVRESLQFNQILVSLNGVSNISASDVYAQKIYDFVDINIGYQFVNILYRDSAGSLGVDTDLINDVREQNGGGGEPLIFED